MKALSVLMLFGLLMSSVRLTNDTDEFGSDDNNDPKSKENLQKAINEILAEYHYDNRTELSLNEFTRVFQRFMTKDIPQDNSTNSTSLDDDLFLKDLTAKVIEGLPSMIKVEDISALISPERIEQVFNELLGDIDLKNLFDKDPLKEEPKPKPQAAQPKRPSDSNREEEHTDL